MDRDDLSCGMPRKCVISRALKRSYRDLSFVQTQPFGLTISYGGVTHHYRMSKRAHELQTAFDRKQEIDWNNADLTFKLADTRATRTSPYTPEQRALHAANARFHRSDPNYVRADSVKNKTLRMRLAEGAPLD